MNPELYPVKLISLIIGCVILGFGVYMEVLADVVMLPGESFVRAIVLTWKTNFGNTKVAFDASMTIIAGILSLFFFHKLQGVREGTIIAALLVGFIARLFGRLLSFLPALLYPETDQKRGRKLFKNRKPTGPLLLAVSTAAADMKLGKNWLRNWDINFTMGKLLK